MRRIYLLVTFLLSLTVLLFEIAIIRLFSVVFFSNFAFTGLFSSKAFSIFCNASLSQWLCLEWQWAG